VISVIPRYFCS